jgi:hypothetical protein
MNSSYQADVMKTRNHIELSSLDLVQLTLDSLSHKEVNSEITKHLFEKNPTVSFYDLDRSSIEDELDHRGFSTRFQLRNINFSDKFVTSGYVCFWKSSDTFSTAYLVLSKTLMA